MRQTTPAPDRSTRFSCPHPRCVWCNQPGAGNSTPRSWTGPHKHSARLRCTACDQECSAREGPLMARRTLPADTVRRWLPCPRWGVGDAGAAARWAVALKPVQRFQRVAAPRAEAPQRQSGQPVAVEGVPGDEAHAQRRPPQVAGVPTALARGSGAGATLAPGRRRRPPPSARRSSRVPGSVPWCSRLAGTRPPRRSSRSWVSCLVPGGVGTWGGSRRPASSRHKACCTPRWSRSAPRRARAWRAVGGWWTGALAVFASRGAYGSSGRRSRPPVWNGGRAPSEGWGPPSAAAPGVCRGAAPAPGGKAGSW